MIPQMLVKSGLVVAAFAAASCASDNGTRTGPSSAVTRQVPVGPLVEPESVEVMAKGKHTEVVFRFWDCKADRPAPSLRSILIFAKNRTICELDGPNHDLPHLWKYPEGGSKDGGECDALQPGRYGISVYGGEKGDAEFVVAEDGSVAVVKGLRCKSTPESPP